MTVIIPHPDMELKITKIQQELVKYLYKLLPGDIFFKTFPLWIPLSHFSHNDSEALSSSDQKKLLKELSVLIKPVSLGVFQYENNQLFMEVTIITEKDNIKNSFSEKLVLLTGIKKNQINKDENQTHVMEEINSVFKEKQVLKIFRLGFTHEMSANSKSISESIWCKLK